MGSNEINFLVHIDQHLILSLFKVHRVSSKQPNKSRLPPPRSAPIKTPHRIHRAVTGSREHDQTSRSLHYIDRPGNLPHTASVSRAMLAARIRGIDTSTHWFKHV